MDVIHLDGAQLTERDAAMACLEDALVLPAWWGRNLDALHDCLTEGCFCLELENRGVLEESPFGRRLLRVLEDAAGENPGFSLKMPGETAQKD